MEQKIIKQIEGKKSDVIYITSVNKKAVFIVGSNINYYSVIKTTLDYQGKTIMMSHFDFQAIKNDLLFDCSIEQQGSNLITKNGIAKGEQRDLPFTITNNSIEYEGSKFSYDVSKYNVAKFMKYCGKGETGYFFNGVFFAENGDIVATDTRRMALQKTDLHFANFEIHKDCFKPFKKSKKLIIDYFPQTKTVVLSDDKTTVISEIMQGQFVNYKKVIPQYTLSNYTIDFDYKKWENLIKETTCKGFPSVLFINNDIYCGNYKVGSTSLSLKEPIIFNANYLNDALKDTKKSIFIAPDHSKACVFGDENFKIIQMPIFNCVTVIPDFLKEKTNIA